MNFWKCIECGCQEIAGSLGFCPQCRKEKDDVPKTTHAGPSNAWDGTGMNPEPAPEPEPEEQPAPEPEPEPAPEPEPIPAATGKNAKPSE